MTPGDKKDIKPLVLTPEDFDGMARVEPKQTIEEELKKVDPKLIEAYDKLSDDEKTLLHRGYKTWKTNGKSEYVLVDNFPFRRTRGSNFTPKKKKRKK